MKKTNLQHGVAFLHKGRKQTYDILKDAHEQAGITVFFRDRLTDSQCLQKVIFDLLDGAASVNDSSAFKMMVQAPEIQICFSSGLSSTIQSARMAIEELNEEYPDRTILCLDTLCAAVGEGLFVMEAARKQAQGMRIHALYNWLEAHRMNLCHWVTVDTFDHLKHGGRVSATSAAMGTLLGIKPLIHVDENGKLVAMGKPRGQKKALQALLSNMEKGWMPEISKQVIIGHGDSPDVAKELRDMVAAHFPEAELYIAPIGPVIGAHAGPGVMTVFFWGNNH